MTLFCNDIKPCLSIAYLNAHDVSEVTVTAVQHGGEDEELFLRGVRVIQRGYGVHPSTGQLGRLAVFLKHLDVNDN